MTNPSAFKFLTNCPSEHPDRYTPVEIYTNWSDVQLEDTHNYIQWCFPLDEASNYQHHVPLLTAREIRRIKDHEVAQESLNHLTWRMIDFYDRTNVWLTRLDHNHLRITRIIKSLGLLTDPKYGLTFYHFIMYRMASSSRGLIVNPTSVALWKAAANEITYPGTKTAAEIMDEINERQRRIEENRHGTPELMHGGEKYDPHPHQSTENVVYLQAVAQEGM